MGEREGALTAPKLMLETGGDSTVITPSRRYALGRDPTSDIVLTDPRVSWHHAELHVGDGHRVVHLEVEPGTVLCLGSPSDGPRCTFSALPEPTAVHPLPGHRPSALTSITGSYRPPSHVMPLPVKAVRIGRATDNDLVVGDLSVSRHHAELRTGPDGRYEIVDLGSHNGTYLNGQAVQQAPIRSGDLVGIGHSVFCLAGDELQEFVDTGDIDLDVEDLTVQVDGGRTLLDQVTFPIGQKCLLAVAGPSGAGKSTLLNALTGLRPADRGTVRYDGRDLYRDYAELRHRIGLVPQDDILHTQLPVRKALSYAAELRFPEDTAPAERAARVAEVIDELGLGKRADQVISSLSGGQRKRVSV